MKVRTEIQVRELFYKYAEELGFKIVESRKGFPDYVLQGKNGSLYKAEAEYDLRNFVHHGHDPKKVDFIIFWKDNLRSLPREYVEKYGEMIFGLFDLKQELENLLPLGGVE